MKMPQVLFFNLGDKSPCKIKKKDFCKIFIKRILILEVLTNVLKNLEDLNI